MKLETEIFLLKALAFVLALSFAGISAHYFSNDEPIWGAFWVVLSLYNFHTAVRSK